jgi:hypothetical protein
LVVAGVKVIWFYVNRSVNYARLTNHSELSKCLKRKPQVSTTAASQEIYYAHDPAGNCNMTDKSRQTAYAGGYVTAYVDC